MSFMQILILGRLEKLSLAELESLFGEKIKKFAPSIALSSQKDKINIDQLGGVVKIAKVIDAIPFAVWSKIQQYIEKNSEKLFQYNRSRKLTFGISVYGLGINSFDVQSLGIRVKKLLRQSGKSIRFVANKDQRLTTAQVVHNHLVENGVELIIGIGKTETLLAITTGIQNIESYSLRDYGRPNRDARVGMLPPKLAQIMLNLARPKKNGKILDPFCGTGVILQEALLLGFDVIGSDINPRMVEYSKKNLDWLGEHFIIKNKSEVFWADAIKRTWDYSIDAVVTEGTLGLPLTPHFDPKRKIKNEADVSRLILAFLTNLKPQLKPDTPVCLCIPAWAENDRYRMLKVVDQIMGLGYNFIRFKDIQPLDLLYFRKGQMVARQILVLRSN